VGGGRVKKEVEGGEHGQNMLYPAYENVIMKPVEIVLRSREVE
jgi:hypothetical protein